MADKIEKTDEEWQRLRTAMDEPPAAADPLQGPQQIAPVVTWLASPAAQEVTNQIIHVSRGTVGIMQQPKVIRSFKSERLWTLDDLDGVIPTLVEAKRAHDERASKEVRLESGRLPRRVPLLRLR